MAVAAIGAMTGTMEPGRAYWERHAKNYERSMALFGKPLPHVIPLVAEAVAGNGDVLEVGAGTGLFTKEIAPHVNRLVATDYSAAMVDLLRARVVATGLSNVECAQADLYTLAFGPASFDAVVAANVLHLVPDLPGALAALRRVLRPGGKLVVPTFCHDETRVSWLVSRALALTGFPGCRRFTFNSLAAALEQGGLRIGRRELVAGVLPIGYLDGVFSPK